MAKRPKVKLYDEKKEEIAYDFGEVKIATKWDDVTLQMMCDFWKLSEEKKELLEKDRKEAEKNEETIDETLDKYNVTDKDILKTFSTIEEDKIDLLPVEFYERLMGNLSFMVTPYESAMPANMIEYNGITLLINDMESLKLKEYTDAETVLRNNRFDYPSLLAILCRKKTGEYRDLVTGSRWPVNEPYDEDFANKVFNARREMFANMPVAKVMPLISFFLLKGITSTKLSQKSLTTLAHQLNELVENIEVSVEGMELSRWSKKRLKKTLKKYKEQINTIL